MANVNRSSILIFYSARENGRPSFFSAFERQLKGAMLVDLRVEKFADEDLGRKFEYADIRMALSRARIVVLLEGPEFLASEFIKAETDFLEDLSVVERHAATRVFRISIRRVTEQLIPESLRAISPAWPLAEVSVSQKPLAELTGPQRDAAMAKIMDKIVEAFRGWQQPPPDDDFAGDPLFRIDRGNLVQPIAVYPRRVLDWAATEGFREMAPILSDGCLEPGLLRWLETISKSETGLHPAWKLELPEVAPARLLAAPAGDCARVEHYAARRYPRHRDAQVALYEILNDLHLLDIADQFKIPSEALTSLRDRIRTRDRLKHEMKYHIRGVMRSLVRKHGAFWKAGEDLWQGLKTATRAKGDGLLEEYHVAWRCIPLCQLGILQRLDQACSGKDGRRSLRQCYTLLERMCHWLHMTNHLMNKVDGVSEYQLTRAQSIRD